MLIEDASTYQFAHSKAGPKVKKTVSCKMEV
jgi:hypothetical protein